MTVYSWADLDPVCTLKSNPHLVPAGSAVAIFQQPVAALLAGCGRCTRLSCLVTFHVEDSTGQQGPTNHHFLSSPKDAQGLQRPNITVSSDEQDVLGGNGNISHAALFPCRRRCAWIRRGTSLASALLPWLLSSGSTWDTSQVVSAPTDS